MTYAFRVVGCALLVLVSRLPFIFNGYGVEEDSWGIAVAAYHTHYYFVMEASRLPGHPVNELIYSLLWGFGPWLYNFLSAICSAIVFFVFTLSLRKLNVPLPIFSGFALVFSPVIYINSTCTIDYLWALMFVAVSFYMLVNGKTSLAAIMLGLAIGCRINSAVFIIPFSFWIVYDEERRVSKQLVKFVLLVLITSFLCYLPVILHYGIHFFTYSDQFPYPSFSKIIYKATIGVVGLPAVLVIIFLILLTVKKSRPTMIGFSKINLMFYSVLILHMIAYLLLPQKSAYLIPVLPFFLIWMSGFLSKKKYTVLCVSLIFSSFAFSVNLTDEFRGSQSSEMAIKTKISGQEIFIDPCTGPLYSDFSKRKLKEAYCASVLEKASNINYPCIIISGWWFNQLLVTQMKKPLQSGVKLAFYLSPEMMNLYKAKGYLIYYLNEQANYNDLYYRCSVTTNNAEPFDIK